MTRRTDRINELFREEISELLLRHVKDPRISGLITITAVENSEDMRHAKVYISVLGTEEERTSALAGLQAAAGFIRHELVERLSLRRVPELSFIRDDSIERGAHVLELLDIGVQRIGLYGLHRADVVAQADVTFGAEGGVNNHQAIALDDGPHRAIRDADLASYTYILVDPSHNYVSIFGDPAARQTARTIGVKRASRAMTVSTAEIGRVKKMSSEPCDMVSDCRKERSTIGPSTRANTAGAAGKSNLRIR